MKYLHLRNIIVVFHLVLLANSFIYFPCHAEEETPTTVKLISSASVLTPGMTFKIGVLFNIKPSWHIYWKNSGDAGYATSVKFKLPKGFSVTKLKWPSPEVFTQLGGVLGYGYNNSVLLWAEVKTPALAPEQSIPISARIKWLNCGDVCIPDNKTLNLQLHSGPYASNTNEELFSEWENRIPLPLSRNSNRFTPVIKGSSDKSGKKYTIILEWKQPPEEVHWFPNPPSSVKVTDIRIMHNLITTTIQFKIKTAEGTPLPSSFESVVVCKNNKGDVLGTILPVKSGAQAP